LVWKDKAPLWRHHDHPFLPFFTYTNRMNWVRDQSWPPYRNRLKLWNNLLSEMAWSKVENCFGPHSVDLMFLDSNAMKSVDGESLRHSTPWLWNKIYILLTYNLLKKLTKRKSERKQPRL
jgi:hypothetical protein